jgi:RNA polymerase sigma factor for flagellar operon FliA
MVAERIPVLEPAEERLHLVTVEAAEPADSETLERLTGLPTTDRETMITHNLPLVRYVAGSMARHASASSIVDYDDLVGYGTEGLIDAVDTFDPSYNVRFSTWAVMHIRTTILDALRTLDPLPRSLRAKSKEIERVQTRLANEHGSWPSDREVASELGINVDRLRHLQQDINRTVVSLDNVTDTNGDDVGMSWLSSLAETDPEVDPESHLDDSEMRVILKQAVEAQPERERLVINLYYGQNRSMREIAERLNISESRVSQLHARAVKLLRAEIKHMLADAW